MDYKKLKESFEKNNWVLKTAELNKLGFDSRKINKLLEKDVIKKIKYGY